MNLATRPLASIALAAASLCGCVTEHTLGADPVDAAGDADALADVAGDADAADGGCMFVAGAAEYWVDARATGPSVGTASCPFHTIREATTLEKPATGARVIHVAGASTGVTYDEAGVVQIAKNVSVVAEGGSATLRCVAACSANAQSKLTVVVVDGGGALDGFTLEPEPKGGAVYGVYVEPQTAIPAAAIKRITASGFAQYGVLTDGSIDVGPDVRLTNNVASGLYSGGRSTQAVRVLGGGNVFDQNGGDGLRINASKLTIDPSASASDNGGAGVSLEGYPDTKDPSEIRGLVATGNGKDGIRTVNAKTSLQVVDATLLRNGGFGIRFGYSYDPMLGNAYDTLSVTGVALGAVGSDRNVRGSLCLDQSAPTLAIDQAAWGACPPKQEQVTGCDDTLPTGYYRDVWFVPHAAGAPVAATGCTQRP